jgi:predicted P-loop ATPase
MVPGCKSDCAPILWGSEGHRKSTMLEALGGEWTATINVPATDKDFFMALRGRLIGEMAELDSLMNRHTSIERIKTVLSTRVDTYRAPYAHDVKDWPRTCTLVGSTNRIDWYKDDVGGRRFWPLECNQRISYEWLFEWREQLFAEAVHLYDLGHAEGEPGCWWAVDRELQQEQIEKHYQTDELVEALAPWLEDERLHTTREAEGRVFGNPEALDEWTHWGNLVTTNRIAKCVLRCLDAVPQKRDTNRISSAMRKLGYFALQVRIGGKRGAPRVWTWVKGDLDEAKQGQLFDLEQ